MGDYRRPPNTYSRRQVAAILGVCDSHVCRIADGRGLTPHHDGGHVYYEQAQVDAFARTFRRQRPPARSRMITLVEKQVTGTLASRVFSLLEEGKSFAQVVIATEGDPATVRELWREYNTSFEQAEVNRKREEAQERARKEAARLERQRQREEHFARKAAAPAAPREPAKRRFVPVGSVQGMQSVHENAANAVNAGTAESARSAQIAQIARSAQIGKVGNAVG